MRLSREEVGPASKAQTHTEVSAGLSQRVALEVEVLVEGGDTSVADEHVGVVEQPRLIGNRKADIFSRHKRSGFEANLTRFFMCRENGRFSYK